MRVCVSSTAILLLFSYERKNLIKVWNINVFLISVRKSSFHLISPKLSKNESRILSIDIDFKVSELNSEKKGFPNFRECLNSMRNFVICDVHKEISDYGI